ncbi:hypothetical protein E2C01_044292 [Portunus trituberculatus]|uniref:Uncharacterized protein n=1 Tax=Portunus trituberculatus TaxID=210409 RepID=A0A5B7FZL2_PORTR|nr:hypothetical protein [Portunus trituberculatus]
MNDNKHKQKLFLSSSSYYPGKKWFSRLVDEWNRLSHQRHPKSRAPNHRTCSPPINLPINQSPVIMATRHTAPLHCHLPAPRFPREKLPRAVTVLAKQDCLPLRYRWSGGRCCGSGEGRRSRCEVEKARETRIR